MTLDQAQDAFEQKPSLKTALSYLRQLVAYRKDEIIGEDTFRNGVASVAVFIIDFNSREKA